LVKKKAKKAVKKEKDDDFWTDDDLEEDVEEIEEIDMKNLTFSKIKELKTGMNGVNITAKVDFVSSVQGKDYGQEPYATGFIVDDGGEIKITFWGEDIKKAKIGAKIKIINASVGDYKGQLQLYPDRKRGIEFI